jgi:ribonuclease G
VTDLEMLAAKWDTLQKAVREQQAPSCLYQEPDLVERVVRDWVTDDVDRVLIDSPKNYERIRDVAAQLGRSVRNRIQLYDGEMPIFDHHEVERQLEETFRRQVPLKSGGCIVIDETEALVAIDVNTGRYKGKGSQEQSIFEVNTEAVEEVARQLRLRNIGGLVVIDLIDMKSRKHQAAVYRTMKDALKRDKAKVNVLPISELGIMEMSRQRMEESILSSMYMDCPYCKGHGLVKAALGISVEVQRQIRAIFRRRRKQDQPVSLMVVVHPAVLERMRREDEQLLVELESEYGGRLSFKSDPTKHMEFFAIKNAATDEVLYSTSEQ